jgi:hypothetical protein
MIRVSGLRQLGATRAVSGPAWTAADHNSPAVVMCLARAAGRGFPDLAAQYFDRAPGKVLETLADRFAQLGQADLLSIDDLRRAAAQFAYLVAGEPLDRVL